MIENAVPALFAKGIGEAVCKVMEEANEKI